MVFTWLFIVILAYFFFSLSYFGDKLILSGPPKPTSYTFYVGIISIFAIFLIPFINFSLPDQASFVWIISEALVYTFGLYAMFLALEQFDVSKVMTTIGATQPIFIFILTWIFFGPQVMSARSILAFALLFIGSVLISFEKTSRGTGAYIKLTLISSLLFSLDYVFSKIVFIKEPFLVGFIWMRIFVALFALILLIPKKNRQEIFQKQNIVDLKTNIIFVCTHTAGGAANLLQYYAISLAPIAFLPIVNSLRGIQYVFLFLITLFFTLFLPKILKEEISKPILVQKILSIIIIAIGLGILVY